MVSARHLAAAEDGVAAVRRAAAAAGDGGDFPSPWEEEEKNSPTGGEMRKRPRLPTAVGSARFAAQIEPRSQRDGGAFLHKSPPQRQGPRASEEHSQHQPASCKRKGHRGPFRKKAALCHCHGCQCHHQLQQLFLLFCTPKRNPSRSTIRKGGRTAELGELNQSINPPKRREGESEGRAE